MRENPKLWLPLIKTYKHGAKTTILIIVGASSMDKSQLAEIIAWQDEKEARVQPKPEAVMPAQNIKNMLLDYLAFLRRKARDGTKKYF